MRHTYIYIYHTYFFLGRWLCYVYGLCKRDEGFSATIKAKDSKGKVLLTYSGPVNDFNTSLSNEDDDDIMGLALSNDNMK